MLNIWRLFCFIVNVKVLYLRKAKSLKDLTRIVAMLIIFSLKIKGNIIKKNERSEWLRRVTL